MTQSLGGDFHDPLIIQQIQKVVNIRPVARSRSPVGILGVGQGNMTTERKRRQRATRRPRTGKTPGRCPGPWWLCGFVRALLGSCQSKQHGGECLGVGLAVDVVGQPLNVGSVVHDISSLILRGGRGTMTVTPSGWFGLLVSRFGRC